MKKIILFIHILVLATFLNACKNADETDSINDTGMLKVDFQHYADDAPLQFDSMGYVNAAGNKYEVAEIQWFVSDITLNKADGSKVELDKENFAHYIDTNMPSTQIWQLTDPVPAGEYNSITITFGIKGEKNKPYMFTDPPESDMLWPINLGGDLGGYHYMKLNGFWTNTTGEREPFNFHLGVGQERDAENKVTGFIQNWFETTLDGPFSIKENVVNNVAIRMNVEKWWEKPNVYDHDIIGSMIMQNQQAMQMGVENGRNVFSLVPHIEQPVQ